MDHPAFTVYSKPNCVQCNATYRRLATHGLMEGRDYTVVDVSKDETALEYVKSLGHQSAPVVVVETATQPAHWAGYVPQLIDLHFKEEEAA